ncbi:hypothetical protein A9G07_07755 [Gilliamella sp. wkB72]|nr:hypothetical protein A9G07_07755 [Gilliamella apicola]
MIYLNGIDFFILSLFIFWWVYLLVFVIGIIILCFAKTKIMRRLGILLIITPIGCYIFAYLLYGFLSLMWI